ncbi:MAG: GTPase family protein [Rhodomicrobium sp.]
MSGPPSPAVELIVRAVEEEFNRQPPTICVIGLSGVGKSSTINAMFGTAKRVSATTRGTHRFRADTFQIASSRMEGAAVKCALRVLDAPGLGEDIGLDDNYLSRYKHHLKEKKCDIVLWILAARNRALALDQQYLSRLADVLPNVVIGVNQADLVDPLNWNDSINMPSLAQERAIEEIAADRHAKLSKCLRGQSAAVAYSALKYYNLQSLFAACLDASPPERRWMFDLLKSFSTLDWLSKAKGLSAAQKQQLARAYIKSDEKINAGALPV